LLKGLYWDLHQDEIWLHCFKFLGRSL
jgi:hypothetical protein